MYLYKFMVCFAFSFSVVSAKKHDILERLADIERRLDDIDGVKKENVHLKLQLKELETKYKEIEKRLIECDKRGVDIENIIHKQFGLSDHNDVNTQPGSVSGDRSYIAVTNSKSLRTNHNLEIKEGQKPIEAEYNYKDGLKHDTLFDYRNQKRGILYNGSTVAFMAKLTQRIDKASQGHIIPFSTVLVNEGSSFTGSDGIFICPQSGLYLFSYNILTITRCGIQVKVNGNPYISAFEQILVSKEYEENAGATIVVRLNIGDHVWLASDIDDCQLIEEMTYFMGVLLFT